MACTCMVISRQISTSSVYHGKQNFRKFLVLNKRGSRAFKEAQMTNPDPDVPVDSRGTRMTGLNINNKFEHIPEMIPELVVPSLKNFGLKPYVSYRVQDVNQREFTSKDLFDIIYADKVMKDFEEGKLDPNGEPLNPSEYEKLTPAEAINEAEKTGTDIFTDEKKGF